MLFLVTLNFTGLVSQIIGILKKIYDIIMIAIPIILLVVGTVDLTKAVIGGDEKEVNRATSLLIKRLLYAALAFMALLIVRFVVSIVGGESSGLDIFGNWGGSQNKNQIVCTVNGQDSSSISAIKYGDNVSCSITSNKYKLICSGTDGENIESNTGSISCTPGRSGVLNVDAYDKETGNKLYSKSFSILTTQKEEIEVGACRNGSISIKVGQTINLNAKTDGPLSYLSSANNVATVSGSGNVVARSKGTAIITILAKSGSTKKCKILVN